MKLPIVLVIAASLISNMNAFGSFKFGGGSSTKLSDPNLAEAVAIYNEKYGAREGKKKPFWIKWGIPATDIDGSKVMSDTPSKKLYQQIPTLSKVTDV